MDGIYGQDQWKIRENLTINVGLRYDVFNIPVTNNILGNYYDIFDFVHGVDIFRRRRRRRAVRRSSHLACPVGPCQPMWSFPASLASSSPDWSNIQPRFGMSYTFRPGTVVHGGYGRTYDNWAAVEQSAQNKNSWLFGTGAPVTNLNNQPGLTPSTAITAQNPLAAFNGGSPPLLRSKPLGRRPLSSSEMPIGSMDVRH